MVTVGNVQTKFDPTLSESALRRWIDESRLADFGRTSKNLQQLQGLGIPLDVQSVLWNQLPGVLAKLPDPDGGLTAFVEYMSHSRSPHSVATLFERETAALSILLRAMAIGPSISETLIQDPEAFELLRITDGHGVDQQILMDELRAEVMKAREDSQISKALHRFRRREILRIAFGQFVREVSSEVTFQQLSYVAEVVLQVAYEKAYREVSLKHGQPQNPDGSAARSCLIAFDRLGGIQQGYDRKLRLLWLAETNGRTDAARMIANSDFYARLANHFRDGLTDHSLNDTIYQIEFIQPLTLRSDSPIVELTAAFQHYDLRGRTWERQAFVQARSIVGDLELGNGFLEQLQPWIYRPYLNDADLAGLGANQRKLQRRLVIEAPIRSGLTDEHRAAEDIEQMVLFLQLLYGNATPEIRVSNTFLALDRLAAHSFIHEAERESFTTTYRDIRHAEAMHFIQGGSSSFHLLAEERRRSVQAIESAKRMIGECLEKSFPENQPTPLETDLILDPRPEPSWIARVLAPHRFSKPQEAYEHLGQLSEEDISVLSTRRCRYYLSLIAPMLLPTIAATPDPDETLANLARMTSSLGGKGILWELMASSPATMRLIVRVCAGSPYLVGLLTKSPGMIDEWMDSLLVDRLPRRDELEATLAELCRNSDNIDRVLQGFKDSMHLRVGVRDILGKESIIDTHRALSDIAEVCLRQIIHDEYQSLENQFGIPTLSNNVSVGYAILALGKLGGQEPNYHSDLSLIVLFEHDGVTRNIRGNGTTIRHFFEQVAQRVMRRTNGANHHPRLYELDARFGPLGKSGVLAMQLDSFINYFHRTDGSTIERMSLCKARPIAGTPHFTSTALGAIQDLIRHSPFGDQERKAILDFRNELQSSSTVQNLKRGEGGTVDVEFLVQFLQLAHAHDHSEVLVANTLEAIGLLEQANLLEVEDAKRIHAGYYFLREVEAGLRLMNLAARHDLPENPQQLDRLAYLLGLDSGHVLHEQTDAIRAAHREIFQKYTFHA